MKRLLLLFSVLLMSFHLCVAQVTVTMELQDVAGNTAFVNEPFRIQVRVSGGGRNTGDVEIEGLENFQVDGTSRSTSISMVNSQFTADNVQVYDVHAVSPGTFKLGPAKVTEGGKTFESKESFSITVEQPATGRASAKRKREQALQNKLDQESAESDLFCELRVDKGDIVVGEPFMLSVDIYTHGNILQVGMEPPQFPGFLSKPIAQEGRREEEVDGTLYTVIERKFMLFPIDSGEKNINPVNVIFKVPMMRRKRGISFFDDEFFSGFLGMGAQTKKTTSNSLQVQVDELPKTTLPVDGVGGFTSFTASIDKREPMLNEPILLVLSVEGTGNIDQISAPTLQLPSFCKFYESKTQIKESGFGEYPSGKKIFEFVVQVGKTGTCTIPAQTFHYFDTNSRSYKMLKTNPIALNVKVPPAGISSARDLSGIAERSEATTDEREETGKIEFKKDIHFIKEGLFSYAKKRRTPLPWWLFLLFMLLPLLFYYQGIFIPMMLFLRSKFFSGYIAKKSMYKFKNELETIIAKNQADKIYNFFLGYFAAKYDVAQSVVSEEFIESRMKKRGIEEQKISAFLSFLNECASLSFATEFAKGIDAKKLVEKSRYWFYMLEAGD